MAFANDAKGYEIRNPGFKGTLGKKDISFLANPVRRDTAIFEGVFDFLAMLTYFKQDQAGSNVLVLNSVGLIERGIARLNAHDIRQYHSYLDHDEAGRTTLTTLRERLSGEVIDDSTFYLGHKDVNDFLMHHRYMQQSQERPPFELER